jgi:hypothetical protein
VIPAASLLYRFTTHAGSNVLDAAVTAGIHPWLY